ncbi:carbon storage regulator [Tissierella sp. MSJ-40]|uniref:Translational regulator CsrA n=1 Tax=Tissierella simiarum TaxID=2841534 RepID=A0ABS6E269_9FIRM|nr:carbon storage regulator [Tissierella simiarum]MBU5436671.1 carbon storage regulator [Tissierella simiarum]
MLVVGRRPNQYIVIGDEIIVKVIKSDEGDLRLAINAPKDVKIVRGEIYESERLKKI